MARTWRFPRFDRRDALKFFGFSVVFSLLLFVTQTVLSPSVEPSFDSSSIDSRETLGTVRDSDIEGKEIFALEDFGTKESAPPEEKKFPESLLPPKKRAIPSKISFSFRPDNVKIDDRVVELMRANLISRAFREKVTPLSVIVDSLRIEPRGQVSGHELIMSSSIATDSETLKVLVHELGHVIDIHYLKPSPGIDPSEDFYSISWDSYKVKKRGAKLPNFISGYALSNKYEDFAESFSFFVFHNEEFKKRAKKDPILAKKYAFFQKSVFSSNEFEGTDFASQKVKPYLWDTTKVPVDAKKYLFYLK